MHIRCPVFPEIDVFKQEAGAFFGSNVNAALKTEFCLACAVAVMNAVDYFIRVESGFAESGHVKFQLRQDFRYFASVFTGTAEAECPVAKGVEDGRIFFNFNAHAIALHAVRCDSLKCDIATGSVSGKDSCRHTRRLLCFVQMTGAMVDKLNLAHGNLIGFFRISFLIFHKTGDTGADGSIYCRNIKRRCFQRRRSDFYMYRAGFRFGGDNGEQTAAE